MSPFKRFLFSLLLILILVMAGTGGYILIEGWTLSESLYMTFITISTVGYGEVNALSSEGRNFTIVFLITSVFTIGYSLTRLVSFLFEGQIVHSVKERRVKRILSLIRGHIIICGFGDIGREVAEEFLRKKIRFVVIDKDLEETELGRFSNITFIRGDAADEEILQTAKIDRAVGLVSCLPDDQQNVFVVLTARQLNSNLHIVTKSSDERNVIKLRKAGANRIISPKQIAGHRLAAVSTQPSIVNFLEILSSGDDSSMRIESVKVVEGSSLIDKSLKESNIGLHTGAIIIGILDSEGLARMNQSSMATLSSIVLNKDDELIVLGNEEQIGSLINFTSGKKRK